MNFKTVTTFATLSTLLLISFGCTKTYRVHGPALNPTPLFAADAPDWVKGIIPSSDDRIYFVGRSDDPRWFGYQGYVRDSRYGPEERYYYPTYFNGWRSEREAVSMARDDVYDQIRQRLAPRNVGNSSNLIANNIDSGTCADCGTMVPVYRTAVIVCNDTCTHSGGTCNSTNVTSVSQNAYVCTDCHSSVAKCSGCATIVHAVTQLNRTPDHLNAANITINRDLNIVNINVDSLMPSLAAYLTEDELYYENRTGWHEYKCWMLCSIPADEFYSIAEDFREKYETLYTLSLERAELDRTRRIQFEDESRGITISRQDEERAWNREDEVVTRAHTIEIDKDRHLLPGRRFTTVDSE
ncbi:MAG: hypothetical protein HOI88_02800 [Phycisphaerae bacterium]|jgi:hypothetical protein|nr:hypothetical protein [Phycisphaerae bacterium]MBT6269263.1 hypothetical protein [Phycisphaerae bacterium]MBT6282762.1 hypothetical protein [Phycisphaerae bacterium]